LAPAPVSVVVCGWLTAEFSPLQERCQTAKKIGQLASEREVVLEEIARAAGLTEASCTAAPAPPVETDAVVQCPMCTRELPLQQAPKHLQQCFRQTEAKMSLAGLSPG
jgi:hypothetical protein